ncbi:hypothetical protein NSQ54_10310 [Alkalihalobacillus sp. FSL W8-0930]
MAKRIKVSNPKNQNKISGKTISDKALEVRNPGHNTNDLAPHFSFKHACNHHFQLSDWQSIELAELIECFRKLESQSWTNIMKQSKRGLGYCKVDPKTFSKSLPEYISPEHTIIELRVNKKARLFGYRWENVFHIIWFDRNHDVYPM